MRLSSRPGSDAGLFVAPMPVRMYVCGITPYDASHLGHAFTYVVFDVLARYLEHLGHHVRHVRNVTDVDDDILRTARQRGVPYLDLAEQETASFRADLAALGCRPPDAEPRATEAIEAIGFAIAGLAAGGHAYETGDGRVYFDVGSSGGFGRFAGLPRGEMLRQFAEKGGDPQAPGKRDPLDFLLWQPSGEGEPVWDSAWGPGRPGWHVECVAMAVGELGPVIDIHGGGEDLIFPHHEAETVVAECLTRQAPFARHWVHTGMVRLHGEKMAKSVGNLVFVRDALERCSAQGLRRYLLDHHYRSGWDFDDRALRAAAAAVARWGDAAGNDRVDDEAEAAFHGAMRSDLDTPRAIAAVDRAAERNAGGTVHRLATLLGFELGAPATA